MTTVIASSRFEPNPPGSALERALRHLDSIMDLLPVGIYACDAQGVLVRYNRRAAELWGQSPPLGDPRYKHCGAYKAFRPDGEPIDLGKAPMSELLSTGAPVRDREVVLERPDGTRVTILANLEPLFGEDGELVGGVNCFQDISEQKRVEGLLSESARRHREMLDALPAAVYTTDGEGHLTYFNDAARELWGFAPPLGVRWCGSHRLYWPTGAAMPHEDCPMAEAIRTGRSLRQREAMAERPDGTRVPFLAYPTPLRDAYGRLDGALNVLIDISERKAYEEQLKLVMLELSHRSKNMLAVIQAMARRTSRTSTDLKEFGTQFVGRLAGLAALHDLLASSNWAGADLAQLVSRQIDPFAARGHVTIEGPEITLRPEAAQAIAMALHELATNAAKYGALSAHNGKVSVTWRRLASNGAEARVELAWRESDGPPVQAPERHGFGYTVMHDVVRQMVDGEVELDYAPTGLVWRLVMPTRFESRAQRDGPVQSRPRSADPSSPR
jgi:PAS domain S-box-containing protein